MSFIDERIPKLEHEVRTLRAERDALREEVSLRRHSMPSEYAKLLAERDALAARHERALIAGAELREQRDALAAVIKRASSALHGGEGVTDQGQAYDLAMRVLDSALKDKP